ncbi:alpha/beta hydrolase [Ensifer sp. ENS05]|uniref:alpha/beta hydrolase family protein n=1 Tax=Ensifer sp. ENS05 TaxID=2769277 RepID=UPI00178768DC|nr:alpha/beta hydrolase [Ensifer sp. ENS05]MBD9597680.1 alpha/beta hydrolase [Ensifer sp. ENS05]
MEVIRLYTAAFEGSPLEALDIQCRGWAADAGLDLRILHCEPAHMARHPGEIVHPAVVHLPLAFDDLHTSPEIGTRAAVSVRVFEEYTNAPERFFDGYRRVIHGRGVKSFKWAIRALASDAYGMCRKIEYGHHPYQHGFLQWCPSKQVNSASPCIVLVHGGFWRDHVDADIMSGLSAFFASKGYVVFNVEYRRSSNAGGHSHCVSDVESALQHLAAIGKRFPIDLNNVFVVGQSAGSQVAHCAIANSNQKLLDEGVVIRGFLSLAGILDLEEAFRSDIGQGAAKHYLGASPPLSRLRLLSPIRNPLAMETLIVHGKFDTDVPWDASVRYARDCGSRSTLLLVDGCDHMDLLKVSRTHWPAILRWLSERCSPVDRRKK